MFIFKTVIAKFAKLGNSPIRKNIIANLYGVCVNLLNQIALVPLYIVFWGNSLYADWIVLSAITVIFSMSDVGLNTVIQNRFSIKLAQSESTECNKLITGNVLIVSAIFSLSLMVVGAYLYFVDVISAFGLHTLDRIEASLILLLIVIRVYLGMYSGIENAIYRATHHNSRCVYFDQTSTLLSVIITALCLVLNVNMVWFCAFLCLPPIIVIFIKRFDSRKYYRYQFHFSDIDLGLLRELLKPAIAFLSFPIGNALLLQGFTFVVNKYYGADEVVSYNTTRTMCNFIIILLATVQNSVWPEYSIAYGKNDFARMRNLHSKAVSFTLLGTFTCSMLILIFGPVAYKIWTHGMVEFSYSLMGMFLFVIMLKMLWTSSGVTLLATNNHKTMGHIYIFGTSLSFLLAWVGGCYGISIVSLASFLIITHLLLDIYTIRAGIQLTQDNIKSFIYRNVRFLQRKCN